MPTTPHFVAKVVIHKKKITPSNPPISKFPFTKVLNTSFNFRCLIIFRGDVAEREVEVAALRLTARWKLTSWLTASDPRKTTQ